MGKKAKRGFGIASIAAAPLTLGASGLFGKAFGIGADVPEPGKLPQNNEAAEIEASRSEELKKRKRVTLLTSPGGALLTAESLAKPTLTLGK